MKKLLLILGLLTAQFAPAEQIIIKNCQVPKVRYSQLFYHAADGRIIFGYDDKINRTPIKGAAYDGFVRMNPQKSYVVNQVGLDCVLTTSDPVGLSPLPDSRPFGIK